MSEDALDAEAKDSQLDEVKDKVQQLTADLRDAVQDDPASTGPQSLLSQVADKVADLTKDL
ncbi:hypothetical protein ACWDRR_24990 [Kitasatospora sp. NPDC003701]